VSQPGLTAGHENCFEREIVALAELEKTREVSELFVLLRLILKNLWECHLQGCQRRKRDGLMWEGTMFGS
jgi:hypothetical protein